MSRLVRDPCKLLCFESRWLSHICVRFVTLWLALFVLWGAQKVLLLSFFFFFKKSCSVSCQKVVLTMLQPADVILIISYYHCNNTVILVFFIILDCCGLNQYHEIVVIIIDSSSISGLFSFSTLFLIDACSWRGGRFWGSGEWVFLSEYNLGEPLCNGTCQASAKSCPLVFILGTGQRDDLSSWQNNYRHHFNSEVISATEGKSLRTRFLEHGELTAEVDQDVHVGNGPIRSRGVLTMWGASTSYNCGGWVDMHSLFGILVSPLGESNGESFGGDNKVVEKATTEGKKKQLAQGMYKLGAEAENNPPVGVLRPVLGEEDCSGVLVSGCSCLMWDLEFREWTPLAHVSRGLIANEFNYFLSDIFCSAQCNFECIKIVSCMPPPESHQAYREPAHWPAKRSVEFLNLWAQIYVKAGQDIRILIDMSDQISLIWFIDYKTCNNRITHNRLPLCCYNLRALKLACRAIIPYVREQDKHETRVLGIETDRQECQTRFLMWKTQLGSLLARLVPPNGADPTLPQHTFVSPPSLKQKTDSKSRMGCENTQITASKGKQKYQGRHLSGKPLTYQGRETEREGCPKDA
ncbi:hypothetical protein VP01_830g2 [Puccinia sorghi]|uniref:Uncharacterized protein n=1 Tax=Puccinia sorghi TaxID=27349 RepID=A0A0L6UBT4_9BASI|nr:hypothetical protein VP01_830g2 [Puccinia sorghi]